MIACMHGLRIGGTFFGHREEVDATLLAMGTSLEFDIVNESKAWWVLSAEYAPGDLMLMAEVRRMKARLSIDIAGTVPGTVPPFPARMEVDMNNGGYYIQGTYRFRPWFEAGTLYSVNIRDWNDKDGKEYAAVTVPPGTRAREDFERFNHDLAVTARFDVTESWLVKLEAHLMKGVYHIDTSTIPADTPLEENWQLFAVKTTFIF